MSEYKDPRYTTIWTREFDYDRKPNLFTNGQPKTVILPSYALDNNGCDISFGKRYNQYYKPLPIGNVGSPPGYNIKRDIIDGKKFEVDNYSVTKDPYLISMN